MAPRFLGSSLDLVGGVEPRDSIASFGGASGSAPVPTIYSFSWVSGTPDPTKLSLAKPGIHYLIDNVAQSHLTAVPAGVLGREVQSDGSSRFLCFAQYENAIFAAGKDPRLPNTWAGAGTNYTQGQAGAPDGSSSGALAAVASGAVGRYQVAAGMTATGAQNGYAWFWKATADVVGCNFFNTLNRGPGNAAGIAIDATPKRVGVRLTDALTTNAGPGWVPADGRSLTTDTPAGAPAGARTFTFALSQVTQHPEFMPYTDSRIGSHVFAVPGNGFYDASGYFDVFIDNTGVVFWFAGTEITVLARDYYFWFRDANNQFIFQASSLTFRLTVNGVTIATPAQSLPASFTDLGAIRITANASKIAIKIGAQAEVTGAAQPAATIPDLVYLNCDGLTQPLASSNTLALTRPRSPDVQFRGSFVPAGTPGAATATKRMVAGTGTSQVLGTGASSGTVNFLNRYLAKMGGSTVADVYNFGVGASTVTQLAAADYARIQYVVNSVRSKQVLLAWAGTNDLFNTVTGVNADTDATIANRIIAWITELASQGAPVQVIGIVARGSVAGAVMDATQTANFNNRAPAINALVQAACLGASNRLYYVSTVTSSSHYTPGDGVTPSGAQTNVTWYTDQVHQTDAAQDEIAQFCYDHAVLNGLL